MVESSSAGANDKLVWIDFVKDPTKRFALSFDETLITMLVTGTDNTLPIRLWAMMRLGFTPDINALVALILGLTTLMCALAVRQLLPKEMTVEEPT